MNSLRMLAAAALTLIGTSAFAQSASDVEGVWVSEGGHAIFELSLCGDGTQLCAKLGFLSEDTVAPLLEPFVGQTIVSEATMVEEFQWEDTVRFWETEATGTVILVAPDRIKASGCMGGECQSIFLKKI